MVNVRPRSPQRLSMWRPPPLAPVGLSKRAIRDAWIEFCSGYVWHWFCTMTFAGPIHPEAASKAWRYWVSCLNRDIFGRHWQGTSHGGVYWVRGSENQMRGVLHYHALMSAVADLNTLARRLTWMDRWKAIAGFSKIEAVEDQTAVVKYVTKYVVKSGDVEPSENLHRYYCQEGFRN